ncbi:MAG: acetyl-CoA C-acyltransferase [Pseudonocardiaceae bacterium]
MTAVYAVDACRTPLGKVKGLLAGIRPDELTAAVLCALVRRNPSLDPERIDDVYWGAANQAGEDNRNAARMGVLLAGLPVAVPGATVNRLCASGLEAISTAARAIAAGEADICIAGGAESMTRAPFVLPRPESGYPRTMELTDTRLGWRLVNPRMAALYPPTSLGETAENVAVRYGVTRQRQDEFAVTSHRRAAAAQQDGRFDDEIVPLAVGDGAAIADEAVNAALTIEDLAGRKPVFRPDGTVTGGNSSPLSDGAAGMLLASEHGLTVLGAQPMARYLGTAAAGVHPDYMGIGPVPATRKLLARVGWSEQDLDVVEVNEAFAAQAIVVLDTLKLDPQRVNVNGGAIALGHPLGCSGARLAGTLVHELRRRGGGRGLASLCIGVGQGLSMAWEAV